MNKVVERLFPEFIDCSFPLINAVITRQQIGKIFNNDEAFFILHKAGFSYLAAGSDFDYSSFLKYAINSELFPTYFHVYDTPQKLIEECENNSDKVNIKIRDRVQLKFKKDKVFSQNIPQRGFTISKIDNSIFELTIPFGLSIENRFWNSKNDFFENGFGFIVCDGAGEPASICYSACIVNGIAEVDVATLPKFQKLGLAKLAVEYFVRHCLDQNIVANWDCFQENSNSLKTAAAIGFEHSSSYRFLSIYNKSQAQ
jgi:GNAT superfamily N-acetyltransferase